MTVLSKMLHVCRPHEMFGPANQCNIRSGDVHFWLNQSGEIIDPTPLNESHPHGENVYIPWKTVPSSILPPPNGEMCTYDVRIVCGNDLLQESWQYTVRVHSNAR